MESTLRGESLGNFAQRSRQAGERYPAAQINHQNGIFRAAQAVFFVHLCPSAKGLACSWLNVQRMNLRMKSIGIAVCVVAAAALAGGAGCAGDRYTQSTGERIDDTATSMRVKKALGNDLQFKYPLVEVKTFKGTAQLSGFVNTRDQKSRAGDIARQVGGVHDIENNITVKE